MNLKTDISMIKAVNPSLPWVLRPEWLFLLLLFTRDIKQTLYLSASLHVS